MLKRLYLEGDSVYMTEWERNFVNEIYMVPFEALEQAQKKQIAKIYMNRMGAE